MLESAVVGVAHPQTGEAVKAYVVAKPGATLTGEEITAHTAERLARFKQPTIVEMVAELPHSVTGKVAKGRLRDEADSEAEAARTVTGAPRRGGPDHPDRQAGLPPVRRGARGRRRGGRRGGGRLGGAEHPR